MFVFGAYSLGDRKILTSSLHRNKKRSLSDHETMNKKRCTLVCITEKFQANFIEQRVECYFINIVLYCCISEGSNMKLSVFIDGLGTEFWSRKALAEWKSERIYYCDLSSVIFLMWYGAF